jgi:putative ABC transport system substrate-binding protein
MRRRAFLTFLGLIGAWSLVEAQEASRPVIGFLSSRSQTESAYVLAAFRQGLHEAGFVEHENVTITFRWAEGNYARLSSLASELVNLNVALLFAAGGPPAALAAKATTPTIPIVFSAANDPVQSGLVASLARPGGNVTGMATLTTGLASKSGELMKELIPKAAVIAYLLNPSSPNAAFVSQEARSIATALKIQALR